MAQVKNYVRLWPFLVAAVGVAGLGYAAWQWMRIDKETVDIGEPGEPVVDLSPNEHYEKVRPHLVDEFTTYVGKVKAESPILVSAYENMRVPVEKIHHEAGDLVKKGDVLVSLYKPQIEKEIEKAKAKGDTEKERLFTTYLANADIKAPVDGVVLSIKRTLGEIPIPGIGMVEMADASSFRFVVQVPGTVQRSAMALGTKFEVELEESKGVAKGAVVHFNDPVGDDVPVVLALEPHDGIEDGLAGSVRVVSGQKEAGLLPRTAIEKRGDVSVVRVYDPDSKSITEKTVKLGKEIGEDVEVLAGAFEGDSVVVPGKAPPQ